MVSEPKVQSKIKMVNSKRMSSLQYATWPEFACGEECWDKLSHVNRLRWCAHFISHWSSCFRCYTVLDVVSLAYDIYALRFFYYMLTLTINLTQFNNDQWILTCNHRRWHRICRQIGKHLCPEFHYRKNQCLRIMARFIIIISSVFQRFWCKITFIYWETR